MIPPGEQHIHAYLGGVPFSIAVLYATIHRNQFLALIGVKGTEAPRLDFRLKEPRMTLRDGALISGAVNALDVLPQRGLTGKNTPACAPMLYRN